MKTRTEIRDWLLSNAVSEHGDLWLHDLDFSDFDGDVFINDMIVKRSLYQYDQTVSGNLYQSYQDVKGDLAQFEQKVGGKLDQSRQTVGDDLYNNSSTYGGKLYEEPSTKALKKITIDELKEMGYEIEKGEII